MNVLQHVSHIAAGFYILAVFLLAIYGIHSLWLLLLYLKHRDRALALERAEAATPLPPDDQLPHVLVQLPVFNERDVVERLVDAVGRLDWPKDRLHLQLLDDSTDDSVEIGVAACARLRARGVDCVSLHRTDRRGFKAGALAHGMEQNDAPYIAIFDADFVPEPDFLRRAIPPLLADPRLCLVQGRWEHLNRDATLLTAAQSLGIDGHFAVEQGARAWSGLAMNFNGTCGLWRRSAIIDAGGWEHDTLTEDMDLSYRAQLKGWRCTYRTGLAVPGEVPATVSAWRSQQFRWAKGSIQTAMKLLPKVWRSNWNLHTKIGASLHMTHYLVHPLILVSLFSAPLTMLLIRHLPLWLLTLGCMAFVVGAVAPVATYIVSQFALYGRQGWRNLRYLPALAALGTGIAVSNASAVWQAIRGKQSAFVRTPKAGSVGAKVPTGSYRSKAASGMAELFCAGWALLGLALGLESVHTWITPLLALYFSGFGWMAYYSMRERFAPEPGTTTGVSPLPYLIPLGLCLVGLALWIGLRPGSWHETPVPFTLLALGMGAVYLVAVAVVRSRSAGRATLLWIVAVAVAIRLACLGLAPSDDVDRYLLEGTQIEHGLNPYRTGPLDLSSTDAITRDLPPGTWSLSHPDWKSFYPPLMLGYESLVTALAHSFLAFKIAGLLCDLVALGLILATLLRLRLAPAWLLVAAWNPVLPLFMAGEGHNDAAVELMLALGAYLLSGNHFRRSILTFSLAAMTKPFAAPALLPALLARSFWWWLAPPLVVLLCYLPFMEAGWQPLENIGVFAMQYHFNGALEPVVRVTAALFVPGDEVQLVTVLLLSLIGLIGSFVILARARRASADAPLELALKLLAMLLLCLPTLTPWYLALLVPLLPFSRSWGLVLWTAMAPMMWLHATADLQSGDQNEVPWITALANLPAVALLAWESFGREHARPRGEDAVVTQTA